MIDFHSHILPDTDDGAVDIIQTRKMLEEVLKDKGVSL